MSAGLPWWCSSYSTGFATESAVANKPGALPSGTIDTALTSSTLEEHQLRLAERHNPNEDFAETLIKKPLRYCLQTYINQNSQEDLKKDRIPNTTYSAIMTTCMTEYETTFVPMNMYAATR